jgi:AraC-like DNA-binding protein
MNTVFTIGIFLSFFLQFLLLSKKQATTSDRILAVWMFIIGISLFLTYYVYVLGNWDTHPYLLGFKLPLPLLHGPMLYLYISFSLRPDQDFTWKMFLHFVPAVISWLYMTEFFFFYSVEQQLSAVSWQVSHYAIYFKVILVSYILSGIVYPIISYSLLGKYNEMIKENFTFEESISLNWLKYCIIGIGVIYLIIAFITVLRLGFGITYDLNADIIVCLFLILFILCLGYFGIRQQGIFSETVNNDIVITDSKTSGEYMKSGLKEEDALQYHQNLLKLMETSKPYLEPKLTLSNLADELDTSVNHLSQVINQHEEKNFFDFVNSYRVEEFKVRAVDPANSNYSILAIALDSGFNSKSSFNQVFKKIAGKTPSQYMSDHAVH